MARRCSPPRWTATSMPCSAAARARSARSTAGSPPDVHLDAGHRLLGEPADPVDVSSAGGDPAGDGGDRGGRQRTAEQGYVQHAAPGPGFSPAGRGARPVRARRDLGLQAEIGGERAHPGVDAGQIRRTVAAEQRPEYQPAADHHLLDVHDGERVPRQDGEQP